MKKAVFLVMFCASTAMLFAQQTNSRRNPPSSVQRSWQRDYPNYNNNDASWQYSNNRWHRSYQDRDNNRNVDVYYDRNGRRIYAQSEWDRNNLPDRVKQRIRTRYRSDNYTAYRIERPGRGFYFQISLGGNRKVYLDERGREVTHPY